MNFNFNFGNKKPDIKRYAIVGLVLTTLVVILSDCTGIQKEVIWDLIDETQREIKPGTIINDYIIQDSQKLQRRIHRDVDRTIRNYEDLTDDTDHDKINTPRYIEEPMNDSTCYSKECRSLGPPMRLCFSWWDGCPSGTASLTKDRI